MLSCRIIVLNYNGKELLERFLPSVLESARASAYPCAVSILDNGSSDGSVEYLKKEYPEVDLFLSKENKVLCSYNDRVKEVREDIVILLNSDIETEPGFVTPLVDVFRDHEDAFFAAGHGDRSIPKFHWGILSASFSYPEYEKAKELRGFTLSAGVAAFHRERFLELGGFDEMYLPGIYEDVDLCYRAWKRGWKGYYEPASRKFHLGSASFKKRFTADQIQQMAFRNSLLFMIKNITDPWLHFRMGMLFPLRLISALVMGKMFILKGFFEAVRKMPRALQSRKEQGPYDRLKDKGVITFSSEREKSWEPASSPMPAHSSASAEAAS
ncbi:MAG TPA: glycosyltransferase family 2 protein [bacterium]|nr:glycosyltransferase family 2 protein [bacterium]